MSDIHVEMIGLEQLFGQASHDQYIVPLYQREYAWGQTEIRQLLDDLWEAFSQNPTRNYHLGTLVVCRRFLNGNVNAYELIDGQQRLTTLSLLYRILNHSNKICLERKIRFDNRPIAENFLDAFFSDANVDASDPATFRDAVDFIAGYRYERDGISECATNGGTGKWSQIDWLLARKGKDYATQPFREFILGKVKLFRVEMPSSTDVSSYFEVMNNRGKQLEYHELVKARLIASLRDDQYRRKHGVDDIEIGELERRFNIFWTECSNMNGYLAMRLHGCLESGKTSWAAVRRDDLRRPKIDKDGKPVFCIDCSVKKDDMGEDCESKSIIDDFSNFLMHVLRLYLKDRKTKENDVPLDDRKLHEKFIKNPVVAIDPYDFLDLLVRTRLRFDHYVVKAEFEDGAVADWTLRTIIAHESHYYPRDTFSYVSGTDSGLNQAGLIKLESMLQVTFRTRRHKEWLYELLAAPNEVFISIEALTNFLEKEVLLPRLRSLFNLHEHDKAMLDQNIFKLGTGTPHFLFNAIDYLLWKKDLASSSPQFGDFIFAYRSSIEHHHSQQLFEGEDPKDLWEQMDMDDIGNLCLVYPNENSALSNHAPREKVSRFEKTKKTCPPKRQLMYKMTMERDGWVKGVMRRHSMDIRKLVVETINGTPCDTEDLGEKSERN